MSATPINGEHKWIISYLEADGSKVAIRSTGTDEEIQRYALRSLESIRNNRDLVRSLSERELVFLTEAQKGLAIKPISQEEHQNHLFSLFLDVASQFEKSTFELAQTLITKKNCAQALTAHKTLENLVNHIQKIKPIISSSPEIAQHPEHLAILLQDTAFIQAYLSDKAFQSSTPLFLAIEAYLNRLDVTTLTNTSRNLTTIVLFSALGGHKETLEKLETSGIIASDHTHYLQISPLHFAALGGDLETLQFLLRTPQDVNATNVNGWSSLFFAAQGGHIPIITELLERGADITQKDLLEETLLHTAAFEEHLEVLQFLLSLGLDPSQKNSYGETIFHKACAIGSKKLIDFCLSLPLSDKESLFRDSQSTLKSAILANQTSCISNLLRIFKTAISKDLLTLASKRSSKRTVREIETLYHCPWITKTHSLEVLNNPLRSTINTCLKGLKFGANTVRTKHLDNLACAILSETPQEIALPLEETQVAFKEICTFYKKEFQRKAGNYAFLLRTLRAELSLAAQNYLQARLHKNHQDAIKCILQKETAAQCPITVSEPKKPVHIAGPDGSMGMQTYEQEAIKTWVEHAETDPLTRERVSLKSIIPFSATPQKKIKEDVLEADRKRRKVEDSSSKDSSL